MNSTVLNSYYLPTSLLLLFIFLSPLSPRLNRCCHSIAASLCIAFFAFLFSLLSEEEGCVRRRGSFFSLLFHRPYVQYFVMSLVAFPSGFFLDRDRSPRCPRGESQRLCHLMSFLLVSKLHRTSLTSGSTQSEHISGAMWRTRPPCDF